MRRVDWKIIYLGQEVRIRIQSDLAEESGIGIGLLVLNLVQHPYMINDVLRARWRRIGFIRLDVQYEEKRKTSQK